MKIRYTVLLVITVISLVFNLGLSQALAQPDKEPAGFKNVTLWIYPEYDDPRLLVMLEGQITGAVAPVTVRFLVPAAAEMYSAGSKDSQGKYTGGPPNRIASQTPGWDEISYELKTDTFRVEYYDPIIPSQPDKKISYDFRWLHPISGLRVIVQQPKNATNFSVSPAGGTATVADGFPALLHQYTNLKDNPLHFDIAYTKSDPNPSISKSNTATTASTGTPLALAIVVAVCLLIAGGFFWVLKSSQRAEPRGKHVARSATVPASKRRQSKSRFCTQCGKPLTTQARFCPHCGAKLRNSD